MQTAQPQGFIFCAYNPGFRLLSGLHPGLCCVALSALVSLGLTRMPDLDPDGFNIWQQNTQEACNAATRNMSQHWLWLRFIV